MPERIKVCTAHLVTKWGYMEYHGEYAKRTTPITDDMLTGRYKLEWDGSKKAYMYIEIKHAVTVFVFKQFKITTMQCLKWVPESEIKFKYGYEKHEEILDCYT